MIGPLFLYAGTFSASLLTFFSGFGLGTLILPFLALFVPVEQAIVYTAVIHLLNNVLKTALFWKSIEGAKVLIFGGPAILGSLVGALLLTLNSKWNVEYSIHLHGIILTISPIKAVIGLLLFFIGLNELFRLVEVRFDGKGALASGGLLSGFFGGLAGLQGAFRSYFLVKSTDDKEVFLGTSAAVATMVDLSRLIVYSGMITGVFLFLGHGVGIITAALAGILVGKFLLPKVQMGMIHTLISFLLIAFGILFAIGVI